MQQVIENGYLRIGRLRGAPIRIHWTAPVLMVVLSFLLNGLHFTPVAWATILALIFIHEMGHALMVRLFGLGLVSVDIKGIGGLCHWYGSPTPVQRALIAWAGVLAQAVLLLIALPVMYLLPPLQPWWVVELLSALVWSNLYLIVFNLLPMPGFDGVEAWKLFGKNGLPAWWKQRAQRKRRQQDVIRPMPAFRRFSADDILEKTPTDKKRPPPHMLN